MAPELPALGLPPLFVGGGGDNLLCGECFFMLAECVELERLRDRGLICPRCNRENVIPIVQDLRALGQEAPPSKEHPVGRYGIPSISRFSRIDRALES